MQDLLQICCQINKFSIQDLGFDRSVCMAAIRYSGPISELPTNEQLLAEKRTCAKFQINIHRQTNGH